MNFGEKKVVGLTYLWYVLCTQQAYIDRVSTVEAGVVSILEVREVLYVDKGVGADGCWLASGAWKLKDNVVCST